MEDEGIY